MSLKVVSVNVLVLEKLLANHVAERILRAGVPSIATAAVVPRMHRHPGHRVGLVHVGALPDGHGHTGAHHEGEQEMHGGRKYLAKGERVASGRRESWQVGEDLEVQASLSSSTRGRRPV